MKDEKKYDDLIDKYLDGEMTEDEVIRFDGEIQGNAALAERINLSRAITYELSHGLFDLRDELGKIHSELFGNNRSRVQRINYNRVLSRVAAAAVFVVGLVFASLLFRSQYYLSSEEIYSRFYEDFDGGFKVRSAVALQDSMLMLGMKSFENEDYENALFYFEKLLVNSPDKAVANFYNGISKFEIEQFNEASESFNKVVDQSDNLYIEQAEWYLGFCYVMTDQLHLAKHQFELIAAKDGFYQDKAKKVARRIRD